MYKRQAYNLLAVYSAAVLLGENKLDVLTGLSALEPVEGRFQYVKTGNNIIGVVDYAHTPDALENVLKNIRDIRTGNETVITIVGCGGDRDRAKRPLMAKIACTMSDKIILTSDNPRSEKAEDIIEEMKKGVDIVDMKKTVSITDRKEAIRTACIMAKPGDIILLAGKGHEKYQEIEKTRVYRNYGDDPVYLRSVRLISYPDKGNESEVWENFVSLYPEKTEAYRKDNEGLNDFLSKKEKMVYNTSMQTLEANPTNQSESMSPIELQALMAEQSAAEQAISQKEQELLFAKQNLVNINARIALSKESPVSTLEESIDSQIGNAGSIPELLAVIEKSKGLQGSNEFFTPEMIKNTAIELLK